MPKVVRCPNCHAPLTVEDASQAIIHCQYCGHDAKQTIYQPPQPRPQRPIEIHVESPPQALPPAARRNIALWVALSTAIPIIIGGVVAFTSMRRVSTAVQKATATSSVPAQPPPDPDTQLAAKLAPYASWLNAYSASALDARARYLSWVRDPKSGPSCKEPYVVWGIQKLAFDPTSSYAAELPNAKELPPGLPELEAGGESYLAALRLLGPLLEEAHRYYYQKDYKDDGCKKGGELHAKMLRAFEALEKADATLRGILEKQLPELWQRQLKREQGTSPNGPRAAALKVQIDAERLIQLIRRLEAGSGDGADAALRGEIERFAASVEGAARVEGATDSWVKGAALELLKVAKEYARGEIKKREVEERRRLPPSWRRGMPPIDQLAPVAAKYADLVRHTRSGLALLSVRKYQRQ